MGSAPPFLLLLLLPLVVPGASDTYKKFDNYRLRIPSTKENKDWAIGDLRVPDGNVEACKNHCDEDDRCKLFNYSRKSKRCWFKAATHNQGVGKLSPHDDFDAYEKGTDPCSGLEVTVLDQPWRATTNSWENGIECDRDLNEVGWFRLKLNGKDATIPTECVEWGYCGTAAPMWLDLEGGQIPAPGAEKAVKVCTSYSDCCMTEYPLTGRVRNCGPYLIYRVNENPRNFCARAFCAQ